jgi:hypothetical protein
MLGLKSTSLNAIIRSINRKEELDMFLKELSKSQSKISRELVERARRAAEPTPTGIEMVSSFDRSARIARRPSQSMHALDCRSCSKINDERARWRRRCRSGIPKILLVRHP